MKIQFAHWLLFISWLTVVTMLTGCSQNPWNTRFDPETFNEDLERLREHESNRREDVELLSDYVINGSNWLPVNQFEGKTFEGLLLEADSTQRLIESSIEAQYLGWDSIEKVIDSATGPVDLLAVRISITNRSSHKIKECFGKYIFTIQDTVNLWEEYMGIDSPLLPGETWVDSLIGISTPLSSIVTARKVEVALWLMHFNTVTGQRFERFHD